LYAAGLALKDRLRTAGVLKTRSLGWPVVSVGSLSAGGAGKTPVVIALAKLLRERGWHVDVLSRGYGRAGVGVERVTDDGARRFGDEPVLIARTAGVPVWVGADRFAAGQLAESGASEFVAGGREADSFPFDEPKLRSDNAKKAVHLLDDGFQHRQLARTVDVVLITAEDLDDVLLPAGNLREGLAILGRADAIVIRQQERMSIRPRVRALVPEGTPLWTVQRMLRFPAPLGVLSAGLRPVAFCAIARPEGFAEMLHDAGCGVIETIAFGDHHAYTAVGIEHIIKVAKSLNASGFVTTEKDDVKLTAPMRARLATVGPLAVVVLEVEFINPAEVLSDLEERLT
jgi:tetraacyldisaccharide 4'-kinase